MNEKKGFRGSGMGVGYVSVMVIFVTVCLTLFAVLSLHAAGSDDAFNERSGEYLKQYYAADAQAQDNLAKLHSAAKTAAEGDFFEEAFEMSAQDLGVSVSPAARGCRARYSIRVNDRQELLCEVIFYQDGTFEKALWQIISTGVAEDSPLNVWDGSFD